MFKNIIRQFLEKSNVIGFVYAIEGLASLYVNQNQPERAALRLGRCHARPDRRSSSTYRAGFG
jgi:hypothetical protein